MKYKLGGRLKFYLGGATLGRIHPAGGSTHVPNSSQLGDIAQSKSKRSKQTEKTPEKEQVTLVTALKNSGKFLTTAICKFRPD